MELNTKKALDNEWLKERKQLVVAISSMVFLLGAYSACFYPISYTQVFGEVVTHTQIPSEDVVRPRIQVKLDSGKLVWAKFPQRAPIKIGSQVELTQGRTIIGIKRHRFVRYVK